MFFVNQIYPYLTKQFPYPDLYANEHLLIEKYNIINNIIRADGGEK